MGFDSLVGYFGDYFYFGVIIGWYSNWIVKGKFMLDGEIYMFVINNGLNYLYGGLGGFGW